MIRPFRKKRETSLIKGENNSIILHLAGKFLRKQLTSGGDLRPMTLTSRIPIPRHRKSLDEWPVLLEHGDTLQRCGAGHVYQLQFEKLRSLHRQLLKPPRRGSYDACRCTRSHLVPWDLCGKWESSKASMRHCLEESKRRFWVLIPEAIYH